jgi:hypothetical protein
VKKKTKKEAKILNSPKEAPVDATLHAEEQWQVKSMEVESQTHLEDDKGEGNPIKLFFFEFRANPETFARQKPTAQELFNIHLKQMEINMWSQGWSIFTDVNPRLMFAKDKTHYRFIIAGVPSRGRMLNETPKTLMEIAHERPRHRQ